MTVRVIIFDWGDTLMRDLPGQEGPMAFWPTVELVPGVKEALAELDPGLVCCVASNAGVSDAALMGLALERGGIREYFTHLFTHRELGAAKPDVRFFAEAARRAGAAPEECVMVGNDLERDIRGARRAGMKTVWLAPEGDSGRRSDVPSQADVVITSMRELPQAIRRLG